MPKKKKKKPHKIESVQPGCILMAQPFWEDEVYNRAIILMVRKMHMGDNDEEVIYEGIIVNKQSTVTIAEALPELGGTGAVYFGGTADTGTINYIHCLAELPEPVDLGNGILIGGDGEALSELVRLNKIDFKKIHFCAGYIRWAEEKLKEELDDERWWIASITAEELFNQPAEILWSYKVLGAGHTYGLFAHLPDPKMV
jgi:putative transcriptional regulator